MDEGLIREGSVIDKKADKMYPDNNNDTKKDNYNKLYDKIGQNFHEKPLEKRVRKGQPLVK